MLNYGDVIFQLLMFLVLIALISGIVILFKAIINKRATQSSNNMEKKLDRIIELLEKDKTS